MLSLTVTDRHLCYSPLQSLLIVKYRRHFSPWTIVWFRFELNSWANCQTRKRLWTFNCDDILSHRHTAINKSLEVGIKHLCTDLGGSNILALFILENFAIIWRVFVSRKFVFKRMALHSSKLCSATINVRHRNCEQYFDVLFCIPVLQAIRLICFLQLKRLIPPQGISLFHITDNNLASLLSDSNNNNCS